MDKKEKVVSPNEAYDIVEALNHYIFHITLFSSHSLAYKEMRTEQLRDIRDKLACEYQQE